MDHLAAVLSIRFVCRGCSDMETMNCVAIADTRHPKAAGGMRSFSRLQWTFVTAIGRL